MRGSIRVGGWRIKPYLNSFKDNFHELQVEQRFVRGLVYLRNIRARWFCENRC